jgi:uncharacterized protein YigA (DUF484 family)
MSEKGSVASPGRSASTAANDVPSKAVTEDAVLDYLRRHPDLLVDNPVLLEALTQSARFDGNVVDMQHLMLNRLREENTRLRDAHAAIVGTARDNRSAQLQVHEAVLQILAARSFEKLIHTATADLPLVLEVDAVTICLEVGDVRIPRAYASSLRSIPEGSIERLLGPGRSIALASDITADKKIFDAAASLVRSQALARLNLGTQAPKALLAIGSRDVDTFHQGQGTELISFLAKALETTIRQWLNLPS